MTFSAVGFSKKLTWSCLQKHFAFPDDAETSETALDLMRKYAVLCALDWRWHIHSYILLVSRLICKKEIRLGREGSDEIKKHKFFDGLDWDSIRKCESPLHFIPL